MWLPYPKGPNWFFVTIYPKSLLEDLAFDSAYFVLLLGVLLLFIEIIVLLVILRQQVGQPLRQFIKATRQLARKNFSFEGTQSLPLERQDEIGQLAQEFGNGNLSTVCSFSKETCIIYCYPFCFSTYTV